MKCSLFLPLISAHTERRLEGYFRKEWRWAAERSEGIPFILPLLIDDIDPPESARVPEAFHVPQGTRGSGDEASADYFQGRGAEREELPRRIRRAPVAVLYGQSGGPKV